MSDNALAAGENDGPGGENDAPGGENDGPGGRSAYGPWSPSLSLGPLPGWDRSFDDPLPEKIVFGARFPEDGWAPDIRVEMLLQHFAADPTCWTKADPGAPPDQVEQGATQDQIETAQDALRADIRKLIEYEKRAISPQSQNAEIAYQARDFTAYFMKLLACSPNVRPNTYFLLLLCMKVGALVSRHFKAKYMRARPVQVLPALDTLIPTPRHPSYPSGHTLQAFLVAEAIAENVPPLRIQARQLALRIGRNREIAGVHFPSDTDASIRIAPQVWACMKANKEIRKLIDDAAREYPATEAIPIRKPLRDPDLGETG